jgi:hypothetical protein
MELDRLLTLAAWTGRPDKLLAKQSDDTIADAIAGLEARSDDLMPESFAMLVYGLCVAEASARFVFSHSNQGGRA